MEERNAQLKWLYGSIDYTSLNGTDSVSYISKELQFIKAIYEKSGWHPAAFCTWPIYARLVKQLLESTPIKTAVVAGGFPGGQTHFSIKMNEIAQAVDEGADEIDFVINRGRFLAGDSLFLEEEVFMAKEHAKQASLKVILETGELSSRDAIRRASVLAIKNGADFIKTSTGKSAVSATPEAVLEMTQAIKSHFVRTAQKVGIKPSGGISDIQTALQYASIVEQNTAKEWLQPRYFRIGASRLAKEILKEAGLSNEGSQSAY